MRVTFESYPISMIMLGKYLSWVHFPQEVSLVNMFILIQCQELPTEKCENVRNVRNRQKLMHFFLSITNWIKT